MALALCGADASAQNAQTGAIRGVVTDKESGAPIEGVTVAVSSTASLGVADQMTDESGYYKLTNLSPGHYDVLFVFGGSRVKRAGVRVEANKTVLINTDIDISSSDEIYVEGEEPLTDTSSAALRRTLGPEYFRTIPGGLDYGSVLELAPGATEDGAGTAHGGGTSPESVYYLDGASTTGVGYGTLASPLRTAFLDQVEIITGGYGAEYGRSTGAVVNVVTKQGGNDFRGSVFSYFSSGALRADSDGTFSQSSPISAESDTTYDVTLGFELGGPIVEDRLWFYVGASPRLVGVATDKITRRRTDCRTVLPSGELSSCDPDQYGDGAADEDKRGQLIFEELDRKRVSSRGAEYQFVSKLNLLLTPDHQGQISLTGSPSQTDRPGITGDPRATSFQTSSFTTDLALKWTSKLDDSRTELEAVAGWHRARTRVEPLADEARDIPRQQLLFGDLGTWSMLGFESDATRAGCTDSTDPSVDPYPFIPNCPDAGVGYDIGGIGAMRDDLERRASLLLSGIERFDALGKHELKAGVDVEDNRLNRQRLLSGDVFFTNFLGNSIAPVAPRVDAFRYVQLAPPGGDRGRFGDLCGEDAETGEAIACDWSPDPDVDGNTFNWAAYVRDSWSIVPNFTVNAGVRYEEQRLRYAEHLRGTIDPFTGRSLGDNAMVMRNMWAPRLGAVYDPTDAGKAKLYGSLARYFESIPMDINDRSFGGETSYTQSFAPSQCGPIVPGIGGVDANACDATQPPQDDTLFGSGVLVAPGIAAQFVDEISLGAEYQPLENLVVGMNYQNRGLGRVIEDVSTDGAKTYILANPGEFSRAEETQLERRIAALPEGDPERERLATELELFRGIRSFDKPRRDYDAFTITAQRRFFGRMLAVGSYTYSRARGNFPGLLSADNGQLDPNITSQYDLIELLANRDGPLPQDRPHNVKLDASYTFDLERAGALTAGTRVRAVSGTPVTALGRHHLYGTDEAFLLPRGAMGRTDTDWRVDLRLIYGKQLSETIGLELYADVFNLFNRQTQASVDQSYTFDPVNPIVGGELEDLVFAKAQTSSGGETSVPARRNRNFLQTSSREAPLSARIGARVTF